MLKNKKVKYRIISLVLVCAMLLSILPQNMLTVNAEGETVTEYITNGNFENGTDAQELNYTYNKIKAFGTTGWKFYTKIAGKDENNQAILGEGINYEIVEGGYDGTGHALKVSRPETATTSSNGMFLRDCNASLELGATYRVSVQIKPVDVDNGSTFLRLMKDGASEKALTSVKKDSNGTWVNTSYDFVATSTKYGVELNFSLGTTGYYLIDDISITKIKDAEKPVVTVTPETASVKVGETSQLTATIEPADAASEITWSSDQTAIATVDENGLVTALASGTANISATITWYGQQISNSCVVTIPAETVTTTEYITNGNFETATGTAYLNSVWEGKAQAFGETGWKFYTRKDNEAINYEIVEGGRDGTGHALKVSRPDTATKDSGGMFTQDLTTDLEVGATYRVSVWMKPVDLTNGTAFLRLMNNTDSSQNKNLTTINQNSNGQWKNATWDFLATSTKYGVELSISLGTTGHFLIDDISITKIKDAGAPTISVLPETVSMSVGGTQQLTASTFPEGIDYGINWSSDNEAVATVDDKGLVTAVAAGTANITAKVIWKEQEITASCAVSVAAEAVPPVEILLPRSEETVFVGETIQIVPKASNADATEGGWIFTSSDTAKATVDENGIVTGVGQGQCTITVSSEYSSECQTVVNLQVWKNVLGNGGFEKGEVSSWKFNNQSALDAGTMKYEFVTDTENVYSGNKALKIYTTGDTKVEMAVNWGGLKLIPGATYKFMAKLKAEDLTANPGIYCRAYFWDANSQQIVSGGAIIGTVETTSTDGWQDIEKTIVVYDNAALEQISIRFMSGTGTAWIDEVALVEWKLVETVTLDKTEASLEIGDEFTLKATTAPADANNPAILFRTSDPTVATVDENGKVTAVGVGEALITATAVDGGCNAGCTVRVFEEYTALDSISIEEQMDLSLGEQRSLEVTYSPENASVKEVTWSSSDETIAYVDENGLITALKEGTAIITAEAGGGISDSCTVTVTKNTKLLVEKATLESEYGELISGNFNRFVTNNTGNTEVTFMLWEAPQDGTLELKEDGSYTYLKTYGEANTQKAVVFVKAGEETALLEIEIKVGSLADNLLKNLTEDTTLFVTRDQLAAIREEIKDETSLKYKLWNNYKNTPQMLLNTKPDRFEDHTDDDNHYALWMRSIGDNTAHLLWAYLFTGDDVYKEKCIEYAVTSASYPKWATWDYYQEADLAAAHQAFAIGLVYNWLYDDLTQEEKDIISKKLYYTCGQFVKKWKDDTQYLQNHLHLCMTGMTSAAMSLYVHADDVAQANGVTAEEVKANCTTWLQMAIDVVGKSFASASKDGGWHESVGYYTYGLEYLLKSALLFDSHMNIDMFTDNEWLENSSEFYVNLITSEDCIGSGNHLIDYGSGTRGGWYGPSQIYRTLAAIYQDETAQWIAELYEERNADVTSCAMWLSVLYADPEVEADASADRSTLYCEDELGIVVSRQNLSGSEGLVFIRNGLPLGKSLMNIFDVDMIASSNNAAHADPALNSVILIKNGEYLLRSDGTTFKKTEYHNTLTIDGNGQIGEGEQGFRAHEIYGLYEKYGYEPGFVKLEENEDYNYIVGDATVGYRSTLGLEKFQRNIVFLKEEDVMLVVDDIETLQDRELELRWFPEFTEVSEGYGIYTIYGNKYDMKFYPLTEETNTEYTTMTVNESSAVSRTDYVFVQKVKSNDWQNAVAFTWGEKGTSHASVRYIRGNGDIHQFEVNDKIYTIDVGNNTVTASEGKLDLPESAWLGDSTLSSITLNGIALEGFDKNTFEYNVEKSWKVDTLDILALPSGPNAVVKQTWDGKCPGTVTIECTSENGKSTSVYVLNLKNDEGLLNIDSVRVVRSTGTKDPAFMYDGYIEQNPGKSDRTWDSKNLPIVEFDLGQLAKVRKIDVAFNSSSLRSTYYNLLVSEDGDTWVWLTDKDGYGEAKQTDTGLLNDYRNIYDTEEPVTAKYVRVELRSHSSGGIDKENQWNSIQEISIFGEYVTVEDEDDSSDSSDTSEDSGSSDSSDTSDDSGSSDSSDTSDDSGSSDSSDTSDDSSSSDSDNTGDSGNTEDSSNAVEDDDTEDTDSSALAASNSAESAPTGDSSNPLLWITFLIFSCAGVLIAIINAKRKKQ